MNRSDAEKVLRVVEGFLLMRKKQFGDSSYMASAVVVESDVSKGWFGVRVATDGAAYDDLYTNEGYYLSAEEAAELASYGAKGLRSGAMGGSRQKLEALIAKKMGWRVGQHYFENVSGGLMEIY